MICTAAHSGSFVALHVHSLATLFETSCGLKLVLHAECMFVILVWSVCNARTSHLVFFGNGQVQE